MKKFYITLYFLFLGVFALIYFQRFGVLNNNVDSPETARPISDTVTAENTLEPTITPVENQIQTPVNYEIPLSKHVFQTFNNCGPASLSMLLSYYDIDVSQQQLGNYLRPYQVPSGDNDDKSVSLNELSRYARENYNLSTYNRLGGDIELLKKLISNDIPVVVRTWLEVNDEIGHYRLIRGYDDRRQVVIQDDSYHNKDLEISYSDFEQMWMPFSWEFMAITDESNKEKVETILGEHMDEEFAWRSVIERSSENIYPQHYAFFNRSRAYYFLGEYERSILFYEQSRSQLPFRMLWYQYEPILSYLETGNYQQVFTLTDSILNNHNRAYSELYLIRGEAYERMGETENAKAEYAKAVQYNENLREAQEAYTSI